jgi:hypothetical protein
LKKAKSLETKIRSAIRLIWSRSSERRLVVKVAAYKDADGMVMFNCPLCSKPWPIQMAEVDHEPPLGTFNNWREVESFIDRMFFGPQRAVCKNCHKKKTAAQRKKGAK